MSTRSLVGTIDSAGQFRGRYVHGSGEPTDRVPELTKIISRADGALGWVLDQLADLDWSFLDADADDSHIPHGNIAPGIGCYYSDVLGTPDWEGTLGGELDSDLEWGYFFTGRDPVSAELVVVANRSEKAVEVSRTPVRELSRQTEQDVARVECGANYERCRHYAWVHYDVPEASNRLGIHTWLGRKPLEPTDAIGARIGTNTYRFTGVGWSGGYIWGGKAHHWYEKAENVDTGEKRAIEAYRFTPKRGLIRTLPGVELVYPPTAADVVPVG